MARKPTKPSLSRRNWGVQGLRATRIHGARIIIEALSVNQVKNAFKDVSGIRKIRSASVMNKTREPVSRIRMVEIIHTNHNYRVMLPALQAVKLEVDKYKLLKNLS